MAGAASVVDRSIVALRRGGPRLVGRAFAAGGVVAWAALGAYYVDEVEGIRALRPLFGALLAVAFVVRARILAGVARDVVAPLLPRGTELPPVRLADVARTASIVATGLFFWLLLPVVGSWIGAFSAAVLILPLCLRGGVAPTWIARAGAAPEGGISAFRLACADLGSDRGKGVLVELLVILGGLAVFVNLLGATALVGLLGRSFLGFDVADLETFFSTGNSFVLLTLAAVAIVAMEPLRAAASAVLYVEARARREGFDLEAAVRALARPAARGAAAAAAVIAIVFGIVGTGLAQEAGEVAEAVADSETDADPDSDAVAESDTDTDSDSDAVSDSDAATYAEPDLPSLTPRDDEVQASVEAALARPEFVEHQGVAPGEALRRLLDRFFEWLLGDRDLDFEPSRREPLAMPPGWVVGASLAVLVALLLGMVFRVRSATLAGAALDDDDATSPSEADPRDRPPESHLDEAARLAAAGAYREAFRALYLATLVALDRRGAIAFDRSRTNWHYLRSMSGGPTREAFHRFTALFDRKWYGDESTSEGDYRVGRELAGRLCEAEPDGAERAAS